MVVVVIVVAMVISIIFSATDKAEQFGDGATGWILIRSIRTIVNAVVDITEGHGCSIFTRVGGRFVLVHVVVGFIFAFFTLRATIVEVVRWNDGAIVALE